MFGKPPAHQAQPLLQHEPGTVSAADVQWMVGRAGCRVLKKLGEGTFGKVCLVKNKKYELMACKVVRNPKMSNGQVMEARLARDILGNSHPKIAEVAYTLRGPDDLWGIFFAWVNGGSLRSVVTEYHQRDKRLPEGFLWHVLEQVAQALQFCHYGISLSYSANASGWRAPVIHGDVKPENLLLHYKGDPRYRYPKIILSDFGVSACVADKDFSPYEVHGTDGFIPPEEEFTFAHDMYALGATIHDAALGVRPVDTNPRRHMWRQQPQVRDAAWYLEGPLRRTMHLQPAYSKTLDTVMHMLLTHRREIRWTSRKLLTAVRSDLVEQIPSTSFVPLAYWSYAEAWKLWKQVA